MGCNSSSSSSVSVSVLVSRSASIHPTNTQNKCDSYQKINRLGQGGFGVVSLVQIESKKNYAMKEISVNNLISNNCLNSVFNELETFKKVQSHDFIIQLQAAFYENNYCYFILECHLGGDLRFHISNEVKLNESQVVLIIACIGSALNYLHCRNIIHRDVKPENIILATNGRPYLLDFGISYIGSGNKVAICTSTSGTKPYLDPSILSSSHCHSYQSDFWSLGILAYELLFLQRPFRGCVSKLIIDYVNYYFTQFWIKLQQSFEGVDDFNEFDPSNFDFKDFMLNKVVPNHTPVSSNIFPAPRVNESSEILPFYDENVSVHQLPIELKFSLPPTNSTGGMVSEQFKRFLYEILDPRPHMRLGNPNDFETFKNHELFSLHNINFNYLVSYFPDEKDSLIHQKNNDMNSLNDDMHDIDNNQNKQEDINLTPLQIENHQVIHNNENNKKSLKIFKPNIIPTPKLISSIDRPEQVRLNTDQTQELLNNQQKLRDFSYEYDNRNPTICSSPNKTTEYTKKFSYKNQNNDDKGDGYE